MTRQEIIDYQTKKTEKIGKYLNEIMEKAIDELESYKNMEAWKALLHLEDTIKKLEDARKMAEKDYSDLRLITDVLDALDE